MAELREGGWSEFRGAIAFASASGNFPDLIDAIHDFALENGRRVTLTFGADVFGKQGRGSDYGAIRLILEQLQDRENVGVHLYHERGRTFHPKLYLFANREEQRAVLFVGSSNWSEGGFIRNVEANVVVRLDLTDPEQAACLDQLEDHFDRYWTETDA